MLQFVKTTANEVLKLRSQMKKNRVRSLSDASKAVYPRQPLVATVHDGTKDAHDDRSRCDDSDHLEITTTDASDCEHRQSTTMYGYC